MATRGGGAFEVIEQSPVEFAMQLWEDVGRRRDALYRVLPVVQQLALFAGHFQQPASSLPRDIEEDFEGVRRISDSSILNGPITFTGARAADWVDVLLRDPWRSRCLREGPELAEYLSVAFVAHERVEVRDPYFFSSLGPESLGSERFLLACLEGRIRHATVYCKCEYGSGPAHEPSIRGGKIRDSVLEALKKLARQASLPTHRRLGIRVGVFPNTEPFHDRSLVFKTGGGDDRWSAAFFVGTGLAGFGPGRRRRVMVGRTEPRDAALVVEGRPALEFDLEIRTETKELRVKSQNDPGHSLRTGTFTFATR